MKKNIEFKNKNLSLNKETIARLNDEQLIYIAGGTANPTPTPPPVPSSCRKYSCNTKVITEPLDLD